MIVFKESDSKEVVNDALDKHTSTLAHLVTGYYCPYNSSDVQNLRYLKEACKIAEGAVPTSKERGMSLFQYLANKYSDGRSLNIRLESLGITTNSKGIREVTHA